MDPFAPLGRMMDTGCQQCTYSPGDIPANDCGEAAAWHILWTSAGDAGLACDLHMATARRRFMFVDSHHVGPDCNMPGTSWSFEGKRCVRLGEPAALAAAGAASVPEEARP